MILWNLLVGHALCDYPLQGDFLARGKNKFNPIPTVPWYQCMAAHCLIHAGAVSFVTGNLYLGFAEFVIHFLIDYGKCKGLFGFNIDQLFHIICKLIWFWMVSLR